MTLVLFWASDAEIESTEECFEGDDYYCPFTVDFQLFFLCFVDIYQRQQL